MMFPHSVPETEPPIGTIAQFNMSFKSGGGMSTDMLIRTEAGWQNRPGTVQPMDIRSWQDLTDLEHMNANIQRRNPGSSAEFVGVHVQIVAAVPRGPKALDFPQRIDVTKAGYVEGTIKVRNLINEAVNSGAVAAVYVQPLEES